MTTIQEYYSLKQQQEIKIKKLKNRIYETTSSPRERKELYDKLNIKCINCKKKGGIKFFSTDKFLYAECGSKTKCDFKIEIEKTHSKYVPHMKIYDAISKYKESIIITKTNYLFRFLDEEKTLEKIEELMKLLETISFLQTKLEKRDNPDIKKLTDSLNVIISELKNYPPNEAIEIYNTAIKTNLAELRKLKYKLQYVDNESDIPGSEECRVILSKDDMNDYTIDLKSE